MAISELNKLKQLDFSKQFIFAYLTCERLYPNYLYFSKNYGFGNPDELKEAIDFLFSNIFNSNPDKKKIQLYISMVDRITPLPANYDTILASSALDACGVVYESLNFLLDKNTSRLDSISTMATDTVDMYIQETEKLDYNTDADFQKKIDTHPLMVKEIEVQKGIITFLSNQFSIDSEDIQTLIHLQDSNKKSNLNL
jgi:uncharacterized protein YjaG (DUF416 family)